MSSNGSIVHYNGYVAGWFDSSVRDFLEHFPRNSESTKFALITSLDSNLAPSELLREGTILGSVANGARVLKKGIILPTAQLLEADARDPIFFGFDEVWFFPDDDIKPKPNSAWLVGPRRIDQGKLERLGPWMEENACSMAIGDGDGLNIVVKAKGLTRHLIAYSMYQPQPTTGGEEARQRPDRRLWPWRSDRAFLFVVSVIDSSAVQ